MYIIYHHLPYIFIRNKSGLFHSNMLLDVKVAVAGHIFSQAIKLLSDLSPKYTAKNSLWLQQSIMCKTFIYA